MTNAILKALAAVAIVAIVGAAPGLRQGETVVWTEMQGASVSDAGLVKTSGSGWNASTISTKGISSGDGYVELVVSETTTQRMFGLAHSAPGPDYRGIDFAFYLNAGALEVYEQGQSRGSFGKLASGDNLRVAVADSAVQFSQNGTVVYTSALAPTYPLLVATSLYTPGATLAGAVLAGDLVPVAVSTPVLSPSTGHLAAPQGVLVTLAEPDAVIHFTMDGSDPTEDDPVIASGEAVLVDHALTLKARAWKAGLLPSGIASATYTLGPTSTEDVTWIDVVGATASGNTLTKSSADAGWNAGADSAQAIASLDGYVEVVTSDTTTRRMFGLSAGVASTDPASLDFGLLLASGALSVQEQGKLRAKLGAYAEGDHLRVAIEGGVVKYRQNGKLLYTSTTSPTLPLVARGLLYSADATLADAVLSGQLVETTTPSAASDTGTADTLSAPVAAAPLAAAVAAASAASPAVQQAAVQAAAPAAQGGALLTLPPFSLAGGTYFTLVAKPDGTVWAWGNNVHGQLGDNTTTQRTSPTQIVQDNNDATFTNVAAVAAGMNHCVAMKNGSGSNIVWAWGDNTYGQLGDNTTTQRTRPVSVSSLTSVVAVAAGANHSLALEADGTVWAWGLNTSGQLGDGTTQNHSTPTRIGAGVLQDVIAVAAGAGHSLALQRDGTVYAWGDNTYGQLGNGTTTQSLTPVRIIDLVGATSIAAGSTHSLAILVGGSLVAWGDNQYGQIGDGTTYRRTSPVLVLANVQAASAGTFYTLAVLTDGTAWAWGYDGYGQLGDNSYTQRTSPAQVAGLSNIVAVAAGSTHGLALTSDLALWAWGDNFAGQLGDGTVVSRLAPTQVSDPALLWKAGFPTFYPPPSMYYATQTATISTATPLASIYYTTDGTTPTTASTLYSGGIAVNVSTTLEAIAVKSGYGNSNVATSVYELKASQPTFSPGGGTYTTAPQNVTLSTTTTGATIRYTFDNSPPSLSWTQYTTGTPIHISTTTTIRAAAWKDGWSVSNVSSATYTMSFGPVAAPTISPNGGSFTGPTQVTITCAPTDTCTTTGAAIRYTTDGTDPATYSTLYAGAFSVGSTQTVKAKAFPSASGWTLSATASAAFTITEPTPTFSLASGTYAVGSTVTVSCTDPAATIRYTLDGNDPTATSTALTPGAVLTLTVNMTLKARAFKTGCTNSAVQSATYTVTGSLPSVGVLGAGDSHSLARLADNTLWAWGYNNFGQLGDGSTTNRLVPTAVPTPTPTPAVTVLAAGSAHTVARTSDASVWAWGYNNSGQLGDGSRTSSSIPKRILQDANYATFTNIAAVAAGMNHCVGVMNGSGSNTVWAWGDDTYGQIGDGNSGISVLRPTQSHRNDGVTLAAVAIAAGGNHSLAVGTDTQVYAWGYNYYGQLGDGTNTSQVKAFPVRRNDNGQPLTGIVAVAGGGNHSLALTSDGIVWAWGYNHYGQLGNGSTTNSNKAVPVVGLTGVVALAAGAYHSLALRQDGTVYAWGLDQSGQLGDGTNNNSNTPVPVLGLSGIRVIAAGANHGLAMDSNGAIWAWGVDTWGQLGDGVATGDGTGTNTPIQIHTSSSQWWVATPILGNLDTQQRVYITCATASAKICHTTDGTEPTECTTGLPASPNNYVTLTASAVLKVKAWETGLNPSRTASGTYTLNTPAPTAAPTPGTLTLTSATGTSVALSTTVSGGVILCTIDGSSPTEASPTCASSVPVNVTMTIKAAVWKAGWTTVGMFNGTYTLKVPMPTVNVAAGTYSTTQTITITSPNTGATVHYTTNGAEPTLSDPVIASGGTVTVDHSLTLKAKAWMTGWTTSDTLTASYTIARAAAATPTFTPTAGSYASPQTVAISSTTAGATIHCTTDGMSPTQFSPICSLPVVVDRTMTLKAVAFRADTTLSAVGTAAYSLTLASVATPQLSLTPGVYAVKQTVTLTCATSGATIHYTTNGIDPTEADPGGAVGANVPVTVDRPMTLKAAAWKSGMTASSVARGDFDVTGAIAAGDYHVLALKADRTLWAWGYNLSGQVGDGTSGSGANRNVPVRVMASSSQTLDDVVAIAGGGSHSLAARGDPATDGTVWAWGANGSGELGNGSTTPSSYPVQVLKDAGAGGGALTGVVAVAAGSSGFSVALDNTGQVWAWGANAQGQVGNGTTTSSFTKAVQVVQLSPTGNLTGVVAIAAGAYHCLALKADGTVWAWGMNSTGQLGDGSTTLQRSAEIVSSMRGVSAITAFYYTSYALRTDGARSGDVWAWGRGSDSEIGDGSTDNRLLPVRVLSGAVAVNAGFLYALALVDDGVGSTVLWGWGQNGGGQLGIGRTTDFMDDGNLTTVLSRPGAALLRDAIAVAGSGSWNGSSSASLAVMRDGTLRVCGSNYYGQLGLGLGTGAIVDQPTLLPSFQFVDATWALGDPDGDGLTTGREWRLGTDPLRADSNGDGIADGAALASGRSATDMDVDGDGIPNAVEIANGTNPFSADSDGDGVPDALDCFPLDPTRWTCPAPIPGDVTPPTIGLTEPTNAVLISSVP